jgi:hypothetical protein
MDGALVWKAKLRPFGRQLLRRVEHRDLVGHRGKA